MQKLLLTISFIFAVVLISGCTDTTETTYVPVAENGIGYGTSYGSGMSELPLDEIINVPYDYMDGYELWGDKGARFTFFVKTDGAPVDLLLLDAVNYQKYDGAFCYEGCGTWNGYTYRDIVQKKFSYVLPETGTYYLVIENSDFIDNGADAKRAVNVAVKID